MPTIEAVAHHEAGHAVIAVEQSIKLGSVSIVADDATGTLGRILHGYWQGFRPDTNTDARTVGRIESCILCMFAGLEAERKHSGRYNWRGASGDFHNAADMGGRLYVGKVLEKYLAYMQARTEVLVSVPMTWAAIRAVAAALMKENELSARHVRQIIQRAYDRYDKRTLVRWNAKRESK